MARFNQLRLEAALSGDLDKEMKRQQRIVAQAITGGLRSSVYATRRDLNRQISRAKFRRGVAGATLKDTIKVWTYPRRGSSLTPSVRMFTVARYKAASGRRSQAIDLISLFDEGADIKAANGKFLAVPTDAAPLDSDGRRKATPSESGLPLVFYPTARGGVLVNAKAGNNPPVLWVLVKQIRISKRFDVDRSVEKGIGKRDEFIAKNWDKKAAKKGLI